MTDRKLAAQRKIREWRENPVQFVREVFRAEPDDWQADYLKAFPNHDRLASKACKGPGKTCVLAWCAWNFLLTRPHPKVVATSITEDNLRDGLWTEMSKWQQRSSMLTNMFTWNKERIFSKSHPETWWMSARTWSKGADANQQADTLAGLHADFVLFVIDEAGGIPDAVVAAAEAGLANAIKGEMKEAKLLIAGNPTHLEGPLYRACTSERHLWWVQEISSAPDNPKRTPRVSKEWAQIQIEKYGIDNPWVRVNVFGEFPRSQANTMVGMEEARQASLRTVGLREYSHMPKILAVDVARFGDDSTVITLRQGKVVFRQQRHRNLDNTVVASLTANLIAKHRPAAVFIDANGVGSGVVDILRDLGHSVIGVMSQVKSSDARYANKRAEMWGRMADWIRRGGCIPNDPELVRELSLPTYDFTSTGQIRLESKDDLKKRGHPSPDKADSIALTFAEPVHAELVAQPEAANPFARGSEQDYNPLERSL